MLKHIGDGIAMGAQGLYSRMESRLISTEGGSYGKPRTGQFNGQTESLEVR